jgi:hypothetical protein
MFTKQQPGYSPVPVAPQCLPNLPNLFPSRHSQMEASLLKELDDTDRLVPPEHISDFERLKRDIITRIFQHHTAERMGRPARVEHQMLSESLFAKNVGIIRPPAHPALSISTFAIRLIGHMCGAQSVDTLCNTISQPWKAAQQFTLGTEGRSVRTPLIMMVKIMISSLWTPMAFTEQSFVSAPAKAVLVLSNTSSYWEPDFSPQHSINLVWHSHFVFCICSISASLWICFSTSSSDRWLLLQGLLQPIQLIQQDVSFLVNHCSWDTPRSDAWNRWTFPQPPIRESTSVMWIMHRGRCKHNTTMRKEGSCSLQCNGNQQGQLLNFSSWQHRV